MSDGYYFPNQSPDMLEFEKRLRHAATMLPEPVRLAVYGLVSNLLTPLAATEFAFEPGMVIARQKGGAIAFPQPVPVIKMQHIAFGYEELLQRKYCLPGFVEVETGDVVIDCGAYVGGFYLSAVKLAGALHAFEPDEANFRCLERNLSVYPTAKLNQAGLYDATRLMRLNVSLNSVEHSLLMPDDGPPVAVRDIQVFALQDYCRRESIPALDFVKIEAEGVELEVYDGLGDLRPRKLAIDVSPERNGQSPAGEFQVKLTKAGYEVRQRGNVMFARRAD